MFLITFEVRDPYDGLIKPFQARVRHLKHTFTEHVFCRPKPNAGGILLVSIQYCVIFIYSSFQTGWFLNFVVIFFFFFFTVEYFGNAKTDIEKDAKKQR